MSDLPWSADAVVGAVWLGFSLVWLAYKLVCGFGEPEQRD